MFKNDKERVKYWMDYAEKHLVGRKIVKVRWMSEEEADGWYSRPVVIHLDDGTLLYPSADDEGNNGGALFGQDSSGNDLGFPVNGG